MSVPIRILVIEDLLTDFELAQREIRKAVKECEFQRVETRKDFLKALETFQPDLILSDYSLPRFDGMKALKLTRERAPLTPLIIWTGSMSEDIAAECMKAGANNYVLKENIKRLGPAVTHGLEERRLLLNRKQAEEKLRESEERYRALFEQSHDGIFIIDLQGRHLDVNQHAADMLGYTTREMMGLTVKELSAEAQQSEQVLQRLKNGEHVPVYERLFRKKDGSVIPVEINVELARDAHGTPLHIQSVVRDITERKQAGEALINSEKRFRALIENGLDDISLLDAEGKLLWESPAVIRNLGYARNAFRGRNIFELMHPDDLEWTSSLYAKLAQQPGGSETGMFRLRRSDGTWRWFEAIVTNMLNEPSVKAIVVNYRDITERKQAEEALQSSEAKFRSLVENSLQGISIYQGGKMVYANPALCKMNGYTVEELRGMSADELIALTHPDDRDIARERAEKRQNGEDLSSNFEFRIIRKDGSIAWWQAFNTAINFAGKPAVLSTVLDITERKLAEEKLRESEKRLIQALAGAQMSVWEWDLETNNILWSPEFFEITGVKKDGLGSTFESFTNLIHPQDANRVRASAQKALAEESMFAEEFRIIRPDGELRWLSNLGRAEHDASSKYLRLIGTVQDITQRKQAELERQVLLEIMQGLAKTKDLQELLRLIHHSIAAVIYAENFFVAFYQKDTGLFEEIYSVDQVDPTYPPSRLEKSITAYVFRTGEPVLMTQELFNELAAQGEVELIGADSASWMGAPLKTQNGTIGVIAVQDYENPNRYSEHDKDFLASIASQVALAIERKQAEQTEREQRTLAEALLDTAATLNSTLDYGEVLDHILNAVERVVPHEAATIMLIDEGIARVVRLRGYAERGLSDEAMKAEFSVAETDNLRRMFETGQPVVVPDTYSYAGWKRLKVTDWLLSNLGAPIIIQGQVIGFILLDSETNGFFTDVHAEHLRAFANQAALAIYNARLLQQAQEEIAERKQAEAAEREQRTLAEALLDTAETLNSTLDYGEVLDHILAAVGRVVPHEAATIMLIREGMAHAVRLRGHERRGFDTEVMEIKFQVAETVNLREMLKTGQPLVISNTQTYPDWKDLPSTNWIHSNVGAPIIIQGEVIGFILLDSETAGFFTAVHAEHLRAFANQAALAIHNARLLQQAQEEIAERKHAEAALRESEEKYRLLFESNPQPMWIYDLDTLGFLKVNDAAVSQYGYSVDEFMSMTIKDIRPAEDVARLLENVTHTKSGLDKSGSWRHCKKDGAIIKVEIISHPVPFEGRRGKLVLANDITEREKAEAELRNSEERFRQLADNIEEVFWMTDIGEDKEETTYISPAAERVWGRATVDELLPLDGFIETIWPEDRGRMLDAIKRQRKGEKTDLEYRIIRPDGSVRWIWDRAFPIFDDAGKVVRLAGIAADITEKKQTDIELKERQSFLQSIMDSAPGYIVTNGLEGNFLYANRTWPGQSEEEFRNTNLLDIIHPEYRASAWDIFQRAIKTKTIQRVEQPSLDADGKYHWFEVIHSPMIVDDRVTRVTSFVQDITERKQANDKLRASEERFRQMADNIEEVFWINDLGVKEVTYMSTAAEKILGRSIKENLIELDTYIETIWPDDRHIMLRAVEKQRKGEKTEVEYRIQRPDGTIRWIWDRAFPIFDDAGKVVRLAGIAADITERKILERERNLLADTIAASLNEVYLFDANTLKFNFANNGALKNLGYTLDEILHLTPLDLKPEFNLESFQQLISPLLNNEKQAETFETVHRRADGSLYPIEAHLQLFEHDSERIFLAVIQDITERKKADNALRESQLRFSGIVNSAMDAIISADSDQRIVLFNPAAEQMFGCHAADAIGQPLERFIPQRYRVAHQRHVSTLEIAGTITRSMDNQRTLYGLRTDGKELPLEASISHIEVAGQHLYTTVLHDITKRKEAEEALQASEERYRAVAELVSDYAYSYRINQDGDMQQEWVTDAFHRITGYDSAELRGAGEWKKLIHPDDLDVATRHVEMIFNGQQSIVEYRIINKSGHMHYLRDFAQPVWDKKENRVVRMIGAAQNITERKLAEEALRESEERFGAAFELAPIGIALVSLDGHWLKVNRALCDLTGYTDQELLARTFLDITHPEDQTNHLNNTGQLLRGEINSFQLEKRYFHKLGHIIWILLSVSIVKDGQGIPQYFVSQIQDITERKQSEKEITRHLTEFTALYENGLAVGRLLEPREIGETIIETFSRQLAWHHATIRLRKEASDELELVAFNLPGLKVEDRAEAEKNFVSHVSRVGQGMSGWVVQTGLPIRSGNVRTFPQYVDTHESIRSGLYMPLRVGERVLGVIGVESEEADAFTAQDQRLLATLASQAAIAFENARLFQAAQQEIMERKRVEFELRDSQEHFQDLFENSPTATWLEDFSAVASWMDGLRAQGVEKLGEYLAKNPGELKYAVGLIRILNVNHAAVLSNGASNKQELIDTVHDLLNNETVHQVMVNELEMIWNGLTSFSFEMSSHKLDGSNITGIQHFFIPTKDGRPDLGRVIVTSTDISDRIGMEQALLTSEAHYRELADSITDVFFELDHNLNFSHWNRASEALTGIPAKDAIGKSLRDILEQTREIDKVEDIYQSVLRDGQPKTFETIFTLKHERRFFEVNAYPSMRGVSVVAKDVTDRKRVEAILEKRFELMEYSAHHSLEEVMQRAVDEVSKLTGSEIGFFHFMEADQITPGMQTWSTEAIELFKVPLSEGQHLPVDQAGVWAEALRLRGSVIQNDYESLPNKKGVPKGHVMITREMVIPIIRNEKIVAAMGVGNKPLPYTQRDLEIAERFADYAWDITERKEMEITLADERNQLAQRVEERTADLSRANSNLARALKVKDEFLANMSHELRTPLNAILGLSESLAEQTAGPLNEKQIRYISTIGESGHHLLSLINDILDLAKIEAGQITLDITKVDVSAVCRASLRMIKNLAQKKNQDVLLEIDEGLGLIWADERRLKQMMVNLLSNAVKFTPEGGTLGLEVHSYQEDNKVTITAWDNGIGISQRDLNQLFLPFVQLDSGLAREATGTGLGLALVAQMARLHGGGVTVTSQPGQGSRFTIMLPWEPALPVDSNEAKKVTGRLRPLKLDDNNKPTILLIEDTQEVTMMISDYLEMNGYKIVTAQDGVEGIAQAKNTHPDLILMDIMMPRMDGLKATRKLRNEADFKHTPIIGLTALAMPEDRNRCIEAGMDDYISKPVNLKALVKIIQKYLSNAQEIKPL